MRLHKVRNEYICDCGLTTIHLDVLLYHLENPEKNIGRLKIKDIVNGKT